MAADVPMHHGIGPMRCPAWLRCTLTLAALALGILLRWLTDPVLGELAPLTVLYGPIALAVWLGGWGLAVVTAVIGFVVCDYLFIAPRGAFLIGADVVRGMITIGAYTLTVSIIIGLGEVMRRSLMRYQQEAQIRRQTEQRLTESLRVVRESEHTIRQIIAQFPAGVGVMDRHGTWMLTNALMDDWVPKAIPSTLPDRVPRWRAWDDQGKPIPPENWPGKRALRGEAVVPGLSMLFRTDEGEDRWMRVSSVPLRDDAGAIIGATCVVEDIDEARRAELALRRRDAHFRHLDRLVPFGFWCADTRGDATYLSPQMMELTGATLDEHVRNWPSLIHPDDLQPTIDKWAACLAKCGSWEHEFRIRGTDGQYRAILARGSPVFDRDRNLVEYVGINYDISAIKCVQETLRQSEERYRTLLNVSVYGVITIDEDGIIDMVNPAAERLFGYSAVELKGKNVNMLMPDPYKSEHGGYLENYRRTGVAKVIGGHREVVGLRKDGSEFPMELAVAGFTLAGKRFFTGIVNDITQRKQAEEELRQYRENLEQTIAQRTAELMKAQQHLVTSQRLASVGTLAAGLAHDMHNLLFPLNTHLEALLQSPTLSGDDRKAFTMITALCDHLRQLARNLSLFSRDPDKEGLEGRTNLARWCNNVSKMMEASIGRDIILKWDCPAHLPDVAIAPHRLTQVVQNLVHNARDAIVAFHSRRRGISEPGRITVQAGAGADNATVVLAVSDNGGGMSEEVKNYCLEPFYTTKDRSPTAGSMTGGSGLGLSLAHQIVDRVGGRMEIDSVLGKGTTFTLHLPVAKEVALPEVKTLPHSRHFERSETGG